MEEARSRSLAGQVVSFEQRVRALGRQSASAARDLIAWAGQDRRGRRPDLERMIRRVESEAKRLGEESGDAERAPEAIDARLRGIERQLRDVITEREEWMHQSLRGQRRREEDLCTLDWLREEQERLTAELVRCARELDGRSTPEALHVLRRVWKTLRVSGA